MKTQKDTIQVVWLKRDLRLRDHQAIKSAVDSLGPVLLIYIVEPEILEDPHYDRRHWRFVWQSLQDLNQQLAEFNTKVLILENEATAAFDELMAQIGDFTLHSHQEIGISRTFQRDLRVKQWCTKHEISWYEYPQGAVIRGLANRKNWDSHWKKVMRAPCADVSNEEIVWADLDVESLSLCEPCTEWLEQPEGFQLGGEKRAWHALYHFFEERGKRYAFDISKPNASRRSCSRLSPYLAWGNISIRQTYQFLLKHWNKPGWRKSLVALSSRLHWHCHFIQKFESECAMEARPVNMSYDEFPYDNSDSSSAHLAAWKEGKTGYPLIDASMRCLHQTGYLNFRMRSMLVSFLCHQLNIDWKRGVQHLAQQFLDFEPGIHYPQFQMQAGITGTNTIRIYNPVKQSREKDPDASFIRKWLPEISALSNEVIHEPWLLNPIEQLELGIELGKTYPKPIVNLEESYKAAKDRLWSYKKRDDVKHEAQRILATHVVPNRPLTMR